MSTEQKFSAGSTPDKISVTTTSIRPTCTTITTEEHDKFQFMANLSNEKARNISEIERMTARNTEIDLLLSDIQNI